MLLPLETTNGATFLIDSCNIACISETPRAPNHSTITFYRPIRLSGNFRVTIRVPFTPAHFQKILAKVHSLHPPLVMDPFETSKCKVKDFPTPKRMKARGLSKIRLQRKAAV